MIPYWAQASLGLTAMGQVREGGGGGVGCIAVSGRPLDTAYMHVSNAS